MIPFRLLAICTLLTLSWNILPGQGLPASDSSIWLLDEQSYAPDSISPDSISGALQIPNVFSPNGDGNNDYFEVSTDGTRVYEFSIFGRSGACIFRSLSPRIFWDGRNNSDIEQREGVYFFVIAEQGEGEAYRKTGFIYLYR